MRRTPAAEPQATIVFAAVFAGTNEAGSDKNQGRVLVADGTTLGSSITLPLF